MLQPAPFAQWPITGDVPDLLVIVRAQMATVADQEALLHAYQQNLNAAQAPAATTAVGTSTGTTALTLASVAGAVLIGATIAGAGVPAGITLIAQQSGAVGGAGVYTTSAVTTLSSVSLTLTPSGGASTWPLPQDAPTLMLLTQQQTAVIRTQTALLQHYQDVLTTSQTPTPPTGP
jgi:hypothetical protein